MIWYAYEQSPIDHGWEHLKTVEEMAKELGATEAMLRARGENPAHADIYLLDEFLTHWHEAKDAALDVGWEGDFRHAPRVFWVPVDGQFTYGFAFKQDNNGSSFVVSPCEMPWLMDD